MQNIFLELSKGNHKTFFDVMADDIKWTWMGTGQWSKTFNGKKSVVDDLLKPLESMLIEPSKVFAENIVAQGHYVVVEARRQATLRNGKSYNNKYCWVCNINDGKVQEVREYMDTALVIETFGEDNSG